jgi:hypothetical protein
VGAVNVADVMEEIGDVLDTLTGLRVHRHPPGSIVPPAGVVSYPERVAYDQTYGRGMDRLEGLPVVLLAGKVTERTARDKMGAWSAGTGAASVKVALESHAWASCDDVHVASVEFDTVSIGAVDYLAAVFSLNVAGAGSS